VRGSLKTLGRSPPSSLPLGPEVAASNVSASPAGQTQTKPPGRRDPLRLFNREPVTIGAAISSTVALLGALLEWPAEVTGGIVVLVTALFAVLQAWNVVGADKLTALLVNAMGAVLGCGMAFGLDIPQDIQSLVLASVASIFGLLARNGVTNRNPL
jgi:hypothetical protein